MKTIAALAILALGQSGFVYSDAKKDLTIHSKQGQGTMGGTPENQTLTLDLKGSVQISSKRQGFNLNADRVQAFVVPGQKSKSPNEIRSATATGQVKMTQTGKGKSSTIFCETATYQTSGDVAKVNAKRSVRIQSFDEKKKQTLVGTGSSGTATLDRSNAGGDGLREATLTGSVRVDIVDASANGGHAIFTGDLLTITQREITLTGHVKGQGSVTERLGNLSGVNKIVLKLNERKEMTGFSFNTETAN